MSITDGWTVRPPPVHARDGDRFVPVVCASVWLLRIGWRRHGAISPMRRPGAGAGAGATVE
jgi:hypothetical protein